MKVNSSERGSQDRNLIFAFIFSKASSAGLTLAWQATVVPTQALSGHSMSTNRLGLLVSEEKIIPLRVSPNSIQNGISPFLFNPVAEKIPHGNQKNISITNVI